MYLHNDKEAFKDLIEMTADETGKGSVFIEKDYYVTQILRLLTEMLPTVVFKGGTSLSKGFHVINRFSEDIDITFSEHIGKKRREQFKHKVIKNISDELGMIIPNYDETQSHKDYNAYFYKYESVTGIADDRIPTHVKMETALGSYAFPTVIMPIGSYIGEFLIKQGRKDIAADYSLLPFEMNLQAMERTYIDKIFALCDYYMEGKSERFSRHLYDIYKLTPLINFDDAFRELVTEVRKHRAQMKICPSAQPDINIPDKIQQFCEDDFYKSDYSAITNYFAEDFVSYDDAKENILAISRQNLF